MARRYDGQGRLLQCGHLASVPISEVHRFDRFKQFVYERIPLEAKNVVCLVANPSEGMVGPWIIHPLDRRLPWTWRDMSRAVNRLVDEWGYSYSHSLSILSHKVWSLQAWNSLRMKCEQRGLH